jgi:Ni,Fe-hydrogenase maturation factor
LKSDGQLAGWVHCLASPWDLVDHLRLGGTVLVLDTCRLGVPPCTLIQLSDDDLVRLPGGGPSSHGGSIAESVRLARALDGKVANMIVLVVQIDAPSAGLNLTAAGREAVTTLATAARQFLAGRNLITSERGPVFPAAGAIFGPSDRAN